MAQAAMEAGYIVHFFGGHALERQLRSRFKDFELTLTDKAAAKPFSANSFVGQFKLLFDYARRLWGSLRHISKVQSDDLAYAVSDYWFDIWPVLLSRAKRKLMVWHMQAPTLAQIIFKTRPDVDASRFSSLYYWFSQNLSLWLLHFVERKHVFYVHPDMERDLLFRGYQRSELDYLSFGMDSRQAASIPRQEKLYDAIWIGRIHRQKGIEDLMETLQYLSQQLEHFRVILVGNLEELRPEIAKLGLEHCVEFSGFVSEAKKFELFCASRCFLMTSRFEGSPRVIGEALACGVPVLAYDVETYRPIFGGFVQYVPRFDLDCFKQAARALILDMRRGQNPLSTMDLESFRDFHDWKHVSKIFIDGLTDEKLRLESEGSAL